MTTLDSGFCDTLINLHLAQLDVYNYQYSHLVNSDLFLEDDLCITTLQAKIQELKHKVVELQEQRKELK